MATNAERQAAWRKRRKAELAAGRKALRNQRSEALRSADPVWYAKFSKCVGLLGSDNEHERHVAADIAFRMLASTRLRWSDIV
jgi:hypothetical protein